MNESAKILYELQLHAIAKTGDYYVIRVPGGWIYEEIHFVKSPVFVPFNNEFMPEVTSE